MIDPEVEAKLAIARQNLHNADFAGSARQAIAEGYSCVDAVLSGLLVSVSEEPPRNHKAKLDLVRRRFPDVFASRHERSEHGSSYSPGVSWDDLEAFYREWLEARYEAFASSPSEAGRRIMQAHAAWQCALRHLADESEVSALDLEEHVATLAFGHGTSLVDQALSDAHDRRFAAAEAYGEEHGSRLGTKMAETSNFAELSIISDDPATQAIIRDDPDVADECEDLYERFLRLVELIQERRLAHLAGDRFPDEVIADDLEEVPNLMLSLKARYHGAKVSEIGAGVSNMLLHALSSVLNSEGEENG